MENTMNKLLVVVAAVALSGCSCERIDPGNVGIRVSMSGDDKGVAPAELSPGYYFAGPMTKIYEFPMFEQNYTFHDQETFVFQTKEGLSVSADVGINYHIQPGQASTVFQKYRRGMDEITHSFLRNAIRDAINTTASTMAVESVYGEGKEKMFGTVLTHVQAEMDPIGIKVSKVYVVGTVTLPESVVAQLNAKIAATQSAIRVENELRTAEAEAKKKVAQAEGDAKSRVAQAEGEARAILVQAEAQAKANKLLSESMTDRLIDYERAKKWNGALPQVTGQTTTLFNTGTLTGK
jgi:regulator of protease activity HflC (stomatin/prohibitin superfamily)